MASFVTTFVLAAALVLGSPPSTEAPTDTVDPEARALLDEGAKAYARGDFTGAIAAFERGYAIDPAPVFLYAWAQAARYAGDCVTALELYDRYLASGPSAAERSAAESYRAKCAAAVPAAESEETPTTSVPPPADAAGSGAVLQPSDTPAPPDDRGERARTDRVGPALLGVGVAVTLAGIALTAVGIDAVVRQSDADAYMDFRDLDRRKRTFLASGVPVFAVGLGLLIGGAVRLAKMRRTSNLARTARLGWTR